MIGRLKIKISVGKILWANLAILKSFFSITTAMVSEF